MSEELFHCAGCPDTHPPMDLPRSAFGAGKRPQICLQCQKAAKHEYMKEYRTQRLALPHCIYCQRLLIPGQQTYCSDTCKTKMNASSRRVANRTRGLPEDYAPTCRRCGKTVHGRGAVFCEACHRVRLALATRLLKGPRIIGFCRVCKKPVPFGRHYVCSDQCQGVIDRAWALIIDTQERRLTQQKRKRQRNNRTYYARYRDTILDRVKRNQRKKIAHAQEA